MGQDYYACDYCGEAFGDYSGGYEMCECGKRYCCSECAAEDGFINHYQEYVDDKKPQPTDENGYELESSCKYCRNEDVTDDKILEWTLEELKLTREEAVKKILDN